LPRRRSSVWLPFPIFALDRAATIAYGRFAVVVTIMATSKPKNPNLIDDLVLNFDPFALNGLDELNVPSSARAAATTAATVADPDFTPPPPNPGPDGPPPPVSDPDFVFTLPQAPESGPVPTIQEGGGNASGAALSLGLAAAAEAVALQIADPDFVPPPPDDPAPGAPPPVADPDFVFVPPEEPDGVPPPTIQEGAGSSSESGAAESVLGIPGVSSLAGASLSDWWIA
jgi:hypothetical protein